MSAKPSVAKSQRQKALRPAARPPKATRNEWRTDAVENLFEAVWELSEPDNPDLTSDGSGRARSHARRKKQMWQKQFMPMAEMGLWEILFPSRQQSTWAHVMALAEGLLTSDLLMHVTAGRAEAAIHAAAVLRVAADNALS